MCWASMVVLEKVQPFPAYRNADVFSWWFKTSLPAFFLRTGNLVHAKKEWVNEMPANERQYH